ncbi:MAG: prephenate dehydratase [Proteobacteria bacterium]|nr:prephenate dehydratase [Pseudomonadota bacterium]
MKKKDREIIKLLNERAKLSIEVGKVKDLKGREVYDPSQESKVYDHLTRMNDGPLSTSALKNIFGEIISSSRALQAPTTVAYLGPEASFSYLAAQSHFGKSAQYSPQTKISEVFDEVEKEKVSWGVVPGENSAEGSVKATLDRLISTPLHIRAEIFLRISHCLISTCESVAEIKRVYSHPQALAQCQDWLRKNLPHCPILELDSTAVAARRVLEDREGAAIGSSLAAATHGLKIIARGIEDSASNTTRFFVIGKGKSMRTGRDKTSMVFGTPHVPGALYQALEPFARGHLNLTRIESYPMKDRMWEYLFFVDFAGHTEEKETKKCLSGMEKVTTFIKVLGSYPRGDEPS